MNHWFPLTRPYKKPLCLSWVRWVGVGWFSHKNRLPDLPVLLLAGGAPKESGADGCKTGTGTNGAGLWIFTRQQKRDEANGWVLAVLELFFWRMEGFDKSFDKYGKKNILLIKSHWIHMDNEVSVSVFHKILENWWEGVDARDSG